MKTTRVLASLALLSVAGAAGLRADFKDFSYRCSPGAVRACASLQVFTTLNGSGGTNVTILVRNLQGWSIDGTGGSVLTRIGLTSPTNLGAATGLALTGINGAVTVGTPSTPWKLAQPGGLGGLIELTAGIWPSPGNTGSVAGGIIGCSAPSSGFPTSYFQTCNGGWVSFTFSTANAWSANNAEVAWLSQRHVNGPSGLECKSQAGDPEECASVVPEPVTMILLGSGLAGVGGVGVIRRRRGKDVTSV